MASSLCEARPEADRRYAPSTQREGSSTRRKRDHRAVGPSSAESRSAWSHARRASAEARRDGGTPPSWSPQKLRRPGAYAGPGRPSIAEFSEPSLRSAVTVNGRSGPRRLPPARDPGPERAAAKAPGTTTGSPIRAGPVYPLWVRAPADGHPHASSSAPTCTFVAKRKTDRGTGI